MYKTVIMALCGLVLTACTTTSQPQSQTTELTGEEALKAMYVQKIVQADFEAAKPDLEHLNKLVQKRIQQEKDEEKKALLTSLFKEGIYSTADIEFMKNKIAEVYMTTASLDELKTMAMYRETKAFQQELRVRKKLQGMMKKLAFQILGRKFQKVGEKGNFDFPPAAHKPRHDMHMPQKAPQMPPMGSTSKTEEME